MNTLRLLAASLASLGYATVLLSGAPQTPNAQTRDVDLISLRPPYGFRIPPPQPPDRWPTGAITIADANGARVGLIEVLPPRFTDQDYIDNISSLDGFRVPDFGVPVRLLRAHRFVNGQPEAVMDVDILDGHHPGSGPAKLWCARFLPPRFDRHIFTRVPLAAALPGDVTEYLRDDYGRAKGSVDFRRYQCSGGGAGFNGTGFGTKDYNPKGEDLSIDILGASADGEKEIETGMTIRRKGPEFTVTQKRDRPAPTVVEVVAAAFIMVARTSSE